MGNCKILNCRSKKGEISFFNVPHDGLLRKKWKSQIEKHQTFDDIPISYPVCALHFAESDIVRRGKKTNLAKNAVPVKFPKQSGEMIVYDSVDEQLVTRHVDSDVRSTEPSVSYRIDVYENSHETNDIGQVGTVEPPVLDPLNVDQTNGAGLETPQGVNVVNHDAIEANDIKCELTLDTEDDSITIQRTEYSRLLHQEIDLIRTTEKLQKAETLVKLKANEINLLQTQVLYYKKRIKAISTNNQKMHRTTSKMRRQKLM